MTQLDIYKCYTDCPKTETSGKAKLTLTLPGCIKYFVCGNKHSDIASAPLTRAGSDHPKDLLVSWPVRSGQLFLVDFSRTLE